MAGWLQALWYANLNFGQQKSGKRAFCVAKCQTTDIHAAEGRGVRGTGCGAGNSGSVGRRPRPPGMRRTHPRPCRAGEFIRAYRRGNPRIEAARKIAEKTRRWRSRSWSAARVSACRALWRSDFSHMGHSRIRASPVNCGCREDRDNGRDRIRKRPRPEALLRGLTQWPGQVGYAVAVIPGLWLDRTWRRIRP